MKLCITIDVDDRAPGEEYCGNGCKGLNKGICHIFNAKLEDYSVNKFAASANNQLVLDDTKEIHAWKRCEQCIKMFYTFGEPEKSRIDT